MLKPLACASETSPNLTRAVVTDGSGSSPNIPKISPFCYLDSLPIYSRSSDCDRRDEVAPKLNHSLYNQSTLTLETRDPVPSIHFVPAAATLSNLPPRDPSRSSLLTNWHPRPPLDPPGQPEELLLSRSSRSQLLSRAPPPHLVSLASADLRSSLRRRVPPADECPDSPALFPLLHLYLSFSRYPPPSLCFRSQETTMAVASSSGVVVSCREWMDPCSARPDLPPPVQVRRPVPMSPLPLTCSVR